jgi:hypothetical protein
VLDPEFDWLVDVTQKRVDERVQLQEKESLGVLVAKNTQAKEVGDLVVGVTPRRMVGFEFNGRGRLDPDTVGVKQMLGTLTLFSSDWSGFFATVGAGWQEIFGTNRQGVGLLARAGFEFLLDEGRSVSFGVTAHGGSPNRTVCYAEPRPLGLYVGAHLYW